MLADALDWMAEAHARRLLGELRLSDTPRPGRPSQISAEQFCQLLAPFCEPTRTEEDFLAHIQTVVATDPKVARWHIVCDNLNIHQSEALVRRVADISDIQQNLGKKGEYGILALMPRRAAFLSDPTHKVVFHYTPNHSSWLNQIEIWLSILMRKVLKRGSFTSLQDLETKVFAFIDDYNATMAKPLKWTSQGKALTM